jgi:phosphate transport system substrate-binding protein
MNKIAKYFDLHLVLTSLIAAVALLLSVKAFSQTAVIKIDGSSTVFPITEAVAEEFQKAHTNNMVTVGISGTGGGFKKFCRGEVDISDASRPISASEMAACKTAGIKYIELPIGFEGMVIAVHPSNNLASITVEELKKIWEPEAQNKILKWNQVNAKWPSEDLKLFGAGSDSGTFDYFTEAIVGKAKSSRGDYTASEDDNTLVQGISTNKNALGYVPMSYYEENKGKLKALGVIGGAKAPKKNQAVLPSRQTVEDGTYYPLSRPLFIYVSETAIKKPEVRSFVDFYLLKARDLVPQVKYVALPKKVYELAADHVKKGKLGTAFGGHSDVGMKIEDIMKKEGKL